MILYMYWLEFRVWVKVMIRGLILGLGLGHPGVITWHPRANHFNIMKIINIYIIRYIEYSNFELFDILFI